MSKFYKKRVRVVLVCLIICLTLIFCSFFRMEKKFFNIGLNQKHQELERTAQAKAEEIQSKYADMIRTLDILAENVKGEVEASEDEIYDKIFLLAKTGYFDYIGISDVEGNAIDSEGHHVNIKERDYFQEAVKGKSQISDIIISQVFEGEEVQVLTLPIKLDNRIVGVAFGIINIKTLETLLENETGQNIYTQIVDSKGDYIAKGNTKDVLTSNKNIWDDFRNYNFIDTDIKQISDAMKKKHSGSFSFQMGDEERISFYKPLTSNSYYVFSSIDSEYIKEWIELMNREVLEMIIEISVAFLILLIGLGIFNRSMNKEYQEVLSLKHQKEKEEYQKKAEIDDLTGIYNAATVKKKINDYLSSEEASNSIHVFFIMDLDGFKQINDTFGHQYGDGVLKEVSRILREMLRHDDILGRLGGDEYVGLLKNVSDISNAEKVFERLCKQLKKTYSVEEKTVQISASFGIIEIPKYGKSFHELYKKTDKMLYEVKRNSKDGFKSYTEIRENLSEKKEKDC